ncbi:MAG TPA: hypothetical protein EYG97_05225 [Arcobacter sp.]|nr:hypothetical protein [Arcobacter sp.]HIP56410.1 hypothetical protein [Arcobacter sp.]
MTQDEIVQASTDPEFLGYLDQREKDVLESKKISGLYEVLDSLLILDLQEERINKVYEAILMVAFDSIEKKLKDDSKLTLENDDIFYIRAFYEHSIEKWSREDYKGAKELFFILSQIVEDEILLNAINIKLLACNSKEDMEIFYDEKVQHEQEEREEKYAYFLLDFKFDTKKYLMENQKILENIYEELKPLLGV